MIYSVNESNNTYTESVALFGEEADEFLESVEVALYEDTVSIGENIYDGADAEDFLAENGIMLYEDHIVLEGQQAEEYKARKAREREEEAKKYDKYDSNNMTIDPLKGKRARSNVGNQASLHQITNKNGLKNYKNTKSTDISRKHYAKDIVERERLNRETNYDGKGLRIETDKNGNPVSWSDGRKFKDYDSKPGFNYNHIDKDKRIAYNAALDSANRNLRRHTKKTKVNHESAFFDFDLK